MTIFWVLRWLTLIVWTALAVRMTPPTIRAFTRSIRQYDPFYVGIWLTAVNRLFRWHYDRTFGSPPPPTLWAEVELHGWYFFAILAGLVFHALRSWYGDGKRFDEEPE